MAVSSCPKCENHSFEVRTLEPVGSNFKLNFVQCTSCGTVVGVVDFWNVGAVLISQNVALKRIAAALHVPVDLDT